MPEKKSRSETLQLLFCRLGRAAQLRQNLLLAKDQIFLVLDLDFRAAVLAKENAVARLYVERNRFALHGLLFRRVWDDDAATDRFLLLDSLHDHSVVQRSQSDCHLELPPLVNLLMKSGRE